MSETSKSVASTVLNSAIAEWFESVNSGVTPDREEFINRYPEIRVALQQFFENFNTIHDQVATGEDAGEMSTRACAEAQPVPSMVTAVSIGDTTTTLNSVTTSARYRGLQQFNKGGLGTLYRAYDESLHREAAIKMINDKATAEPGLLAQFRVEAEITGQLDHPGVVPVYGFGEDWNGRPFYVMPMIRGQELGKAIKAYHQSRTANPGGKETRRQLLTLLEHLISACKTIAYAHDAEIIHCDIKPANIMIGKYGETFVLDWGLAFRIDSEEGHTRNELNKSRTHSSGESSRHGPRGGTYGYISPEQLTPDEPITATSDVYSLGATLYEILVGTPPFNGRDPNVGEKIRRGDFRHPHDVLSSIPRSLDGICQKAMSANPDDRYSSATLLACDLTNWMRDDELLATPDRWHQRIARFGRRHRGIAVTTGIAAVVVATFTVWTIHETEKRRYVDSQNAIVKQSLDTSLKTLENLCRPLANGEMLNLTVLLPAMNTINDFAREYLGKYEKLESMQSHTGRVYELRATASRVLASDTKTVLKYYKEAEKACEKQYEVTTDEAEKDELQRRIIDFQLNQSSLYIQRKEYEPAESLLKQALKSSDKLMERHRDDTGLLRDLAEVKHLLGELTLNREAEGEEYDRALVKSRSYFEGSRDILSNLLEKAEGDEIRNRQRDLARNYGYLGDLYLAQGYVAKAEQAYKDSEEYRNELYQSNRRDAEYRFQYARGVGNFGSLERNYGGRLDAAADHLQKTIDLASSLTEEFPWMPTFRSDLAYYQNGLAEIYLWQAIDHPDKTAGLDQALEAVEITEKHLRNVAESDSEIAGSLVTQAAIAMLRNDDKKAVLLAKNAKDRIVSSGRGASLSRDALVTLALAESLQGDAKASYEALQKAVDLGANTCVRFENHRGAALKALDQHATYGPLYRKLCEKVRSKIRFQ